MPFAIFENRLQGLQRCRPTVTCKASSGACLKCMRPAWFLAKHCFCSMTFINFFFSISLFNFAGMRQSDSTALTQGVYDLFGPSLGRLWHYFLIGYAICKDSKPLSLHEWMHAHLLAESNSL